MFLVRVLLIAVLVTTGFSTSMAASSSGGGTGSTYFGFNVGLNTTSQDDINLLQSRANTRDSGISAKQLTSAYEFGAEIGYRFNGSIFGLALRPGYFMSNSSGSGTSGTYKYKVTGFSLFPILRLYPLENSIMRFFMQAGLGYGMSNGAVEEGTAAVEFRGSSYGSLIGLGAEFLTTPNHVIALEGNLRYLSFERNIATSASGTFATGTNASLSQAIVDREVELDTTDLKTSMSGLQFMARYCYYF